MERGHKLPYCDSSKPLKLEVQINQLFPTKVQPQHWTPDQYLIGKGQVGMVDSSTNTWYIVGVETTGVPCVRTATHQVSDPSKYVPYQLVWVSRKEKKTCLEQYRKAIISVNYMKTICALLKTQNE